MLTDEEKAASSAAALIRKVTPELAIEKGLQLRAALAIPELKGGIKRQISDMITALVVAFGAEAEFTKPHKAELASSISAEHGNLNVEEIALVFKYGREGKYGKQYHKLNVVTVLYWLTEYAKSEERLGYFERKQAERPTGPDTSVMEALFEVGLLSEERLPGKSIDAAGPVKSRAERLREEAEKIEKEEAAELERKRLIAQWIANGDERGKSFEGFIKSEYYDKLEPYEAEIVREAGSRFLTVDEADVYSELVERYRAVVAVWNAQTDEEAGFGKNDE